MMYWGFPGNFGLRGFNGYGGWGGFSNYGWVGLIGMAIHLLFWVVIILIALYLIRRYRKQPHHFLGLGQNRALAILRERYARGEINTEEFEKRREMLLK